MQNTLFCIKFALFFWFCLPNRAEVERSALFFLLNFVCFSEKSQKNAVFLEKKAVFLKKNHVFFVLFFCNRCTVRDT